MRSPTRAFPLTLALSLTALLVSCSGGGPTAPGEAPLVPEPGVVGALPTGDLTIGPVGNAMALGHVVLTLDPEAGTAAVTPVRMNQALNDAFIVGINELDAFCDCVKLLGVRRNGNPSGRGISVDIEFTHPFPFDQRPNLFGWDLRAIVATDYNAVDFPAANVTVPAGVVTNAAGYTEEWTPAIVTELGLTSDAFPYVILREDRTVQDPFDYQNPSGWNVFPSGGSGTATLDFDLPVSGAVSVDLFFTAGFHVAATASTRQNPVYAPPRGNSRSPWKVAAAFAAPGLTSLGGSSAPVDLFIWDWQHGQGLSSDVASATIYAPSILSTSQTITLGPGGGRDVDPVTAPFVLSNQLGTAAPGTYYALIEVVDQLDGQNPGGLNNENGVHRLGDDFETVDLPQEVRTYQVLTLDLTSLPGVDPVAQVTATPPITAGQVTVAIGGTVQWDASTSFDPDAPLSPEGDIVGYEWDFEWDGVSANFVDDTAGAGTALESHAYPTAGLTTMGLRVEDGVGRKSVILGITVDVSPLVLTLVLEPAAQDLSAPIFSPPNFDNVDGEEMSPSLVQLPNGDYQVIFHTGQNYAPSVGFPGRTSIACPSIWNGSAWPPATSTVFGTTGGGGTLEFGLRMKSTPNWATGRALGTHAFYNIPSHSPQSSPVFFFNAPFFNGYGYVGNTNVQSYAHEIVCARPPATSIFTFGDGGGQLKAWRGGPEADVPGVDWLASGVFTTVVDGRPSQVSQSRSSASTPDGGMHIAYRATDRSQLRLARDPDTDNAGWVINDLATGTAGDFGDPALEADEAGGLHLVVSRLVAGQHQLELYSSADAGVTWGAAVPVGAPLAAVPADLSLGVRDLLGTRIFAVTYNTAGGLENPGEIWIRWKGAASATWTDQQLSTGAISTEPEMLIGRTAPDMFAAWVEPVAGRDNVLVRHGTWQYL